MKKALFIFIIPMCVFSFDANAQLFKDFKCLFKPRDCVKEEVDEQNKILTRLWIKQQLIRFSTQKQTEKSTMGKLSEVFHQWQRLRDFYKKDGDLLEKFSSVFLSEYAQTVSLITEINSKLNDNYWEPVEKQQYTQALTNMTIAIIRVNEKVLEAGRDNEHSGTFWSFISQFEPTDGMSPDNSIFEGATIFNRENQSFKNVVSAVIGVLSVGFFDRTGNVINNADRVKMLQEAESTRAQVKRDLHRLLEDILEIIVIKKNNTKVNSSQQLLQSN